METGDIQTTTPMPTPPPIRAITSHLVPGAKLELALRSIDEPGPGGAHHAYEAVFPDQSSMPITFQKGAIATESDLNGLTNEILLAAVLDRLEKFQLGPFACVENANAIAYITNGLNWLKQRTAERIRRNVEGTHAR